MKAIKILLSALAVLIIVIGVTLYLVAQNIDSIVKTAIETMGSDALQTEVTVEDASFKIKRGRGEIKALRIKNPTGYSEPYFFELHNAIIRIDPINLTRKPLVIDEILIKGAHLTLQHKGIKDTNLQTLLNNLKPNHNDGKNTDQSKSQTDTIATKYMLKRLTFTNSSMDIISDHAKNKTLTLRDIQQTNIGTKEGGLTGNQLAIAIAQPLLKEAREKFEGKLKSKIKDKLEETINKSLSDKNKEKLDKFKSLLGK